MIASFALRGTRVIKVEGEVDLSCVARLHAHIDGAFAAGHSRFVIDLAQVTFLDSNAIHTLIRTRERARRAGGEVAVVSVDPGICRVLDVFGLTREIEIFDSADAAALSLAAV